MPGKGQRARAAIVEVASDLFYRQGYGATSYADIAVRTGFGKGNIHYYFNSKEELLKAVAEMRMEKYRKLLEQWSLECGPPYDCLERIVSLFEKNAGDLAKYGCPIGTLNDELGKNNPELQEEARQMMDIFLRWLEARFRALLPPDEARDHAEQLLAMAQGAALLAHAYRDPGLVKRQADAARHWLSKICENEPHA